MTISCKELVEKAVQQNNVRVVDGNASTANNQVTGEVMELISVDGIGSICVLHGFIGKRTAEDKVEAKVHAVNRLTINANQNVYYGKDGETIFLGSEETNSTDCQVDRDLQQILLNVLSPILSPKDEIGQKAVEITKVYLSPSTPRSPSITLE